MIILQFTPQYIMIPFLYCPYDHIRALFHSLFKTISQDEL